MNIQEMHDTFRGLRDLYKAPYYEHDEIDIFLNSAINAFVVNQIPDPKKGRISVESQKTWDQISTLVTSQKVTAFTSGNTVTDVVDLASCSFTKNNDYWFYYASTCVINGNRAGINIIDYNQISSLADDAFSGPNDDDIDIVFVGSDIYIISKTIPQRFNLLYVKKPIKVSFDGNVSCNLPESSHDRVCHMAVQISCGGSNLNELYKIQENEVNKR